MPHNRVFGPYIFPFSQSLLLAINNGIKTVKNRSHDVIVVGSLYEPRTTIVRELTDQLKKKGIHLYKTGGSHASLMRISNTEYWSNLEDSKICFTTADHAVETKGDYLHVRHLIYRYLEALACGCILVAQHVPSADHILEVGFDYLGYENIEDAVEKIESLLKDEKVLQEMVNRNQLKFATIIQNFGFWKFAMDSSDIVKLRE
jgi:glycosyltransferase involved in cell wall biosynthesis